MRNPFVVVLVFCVGILFYCYEFFLRLLTGAFETDIISHFHIHTQIGYSFLTSSYNLTYLLMQIPAGILLDRFGSKKVLTWATLCCGLGIIIFISGDYSLALFGRLLVGLGSSFAFVGVLKISREYLPQRYFAFFAGIVIALGTLAAAFSEQLTVLLASRSVSWMHLFFYCGLMALPLAFLFYYSLHAARKNTLTAIMPNWHDTGRQLRQLIKIPALWSNAVWAGLLYLPTVVITAQYGISYFSTLYHTSHYQSVEGITFILLGWVICSPIISYFASARNKIRILLVTLSILAGIVLFYLTFLPHYSQNHLFLLTFLLGAFSAGQVLVWYVFNLICPASLSGVGIALTNMIITAVTEVGQLTAGLLWDWQRTSSVLAKIVGYFDPIQFVALLFFIAILSGVIIFYYSSRKVTV